MIQMEFTCKTSSSYHPITRMALPAPQLLLGVTVKLYVVLESSPLLVHGLLGRHVPQFVGDGTQVTVTDVNGGLSEG